MGVDKFLDNTVWKVGRGAKKVKDIAGAPGRKVEEIKERVIEKVTPTCRRNGGSLSCKSGDPKKKRGRGASCVYCGNGIL